MPRGMRLTFEMKETAAGPSPLPHLLQKLVFSRLRTPQHGCPWNQGRLFSFLLSMGSSLRCTTPSHCLLLSISGHDVGVMRKVPGTCSGLC